MWLLPQQHLPYMKLRLYLLRHNIFSYRKHFQCKCRGLFFRSTANRVQNPRNLPKAQSPSGPVVHGSKNIKRNGLQPLIKPKTKEEAQPIQPIDSYQQKRHMRVQNNSKRRGKNGSHVKLHFSLLSWRGARGAEGKHFQDKNQLPKAS